MKNLIFVLLSFALPPGTWAQEGGLPAGFRDIPWQKNEIISETPEARQDGRAISRGILGGAKTGPRFEGWYTRITNKDGDRTIAFITGSFLPGGVQFSPALAMPGYLAVLISDGAQKALKVYEAFPESTAVSVNGKKVFNENPLEISLSGLRADFEWTAQGCGYISNKSFALEIPGEISVRGNFGTPVYWNNDISASPEGIAAHIPLVPVHWYVHSLGSPSDYEYAIPREGISVISSGYAHIEKNWGKSFPDKWIWSEGITDGNGSHYAVAGGEVDLGAFKMTAFLAGFHTQKTSLDFKPQQGTLFKTIIDGCSGTFSMVLARPGKRLIIDSGADPKTFGKVSIPTAGGFTANGGAESFSARTTIEAYDIDFSGKPTLIEKKTFDNSALEFGANYMCGR